jgi:hypothetical protein
MKTLAESVARPHVAEAFEVEISDEFKPVTADKLS